MTTYESAPSFQAALAACEQLANQRLEGTRSETASTGHRLSARLLTTRDALEAAYRLRYDVYVRQMGHKQFHADHTEGRIEEPLDQSGRVLGVYAGPDLVGTVRTNYARDSRLGYYEQLYEMSAVGPHHPKRTAISTKLMVHPAFRRRVLSVSSLLVLAAYATQLVDGIRFNFIDCTSVMERFFTRFGFQRHIASVRHPEYGPSVCMALDLHDFEHIARVRSPFTPLARPELITGGRQRESIPTAHAGIERGRLA